MIGLKKGSITLLTHDPEWGLEAERTCFRLSKVLGNISKDSQHIGSTSIPLVQARPIIDLAVAVDEFEDVLSLKNQLKQAGFYYCPTISTKAQLLLACGSFYEGTGELQTHEIRIVLTNSREWHDLLYFRDALKQRPELANNYQKVKQVFADTSNSKIKRKQYLTGKQAFILQTIRKALVKDYLGKVVDIKIDRVLGSAHPNYPDMIYPVNYGFIPEVLGGDGEELDVYLLGVNQPVAEYRGEVIGIVHRHDDMEDKLIAVPKGVRLTKKEIETATAFQEQYYQSEAEILPL